MYSEALRALSFDTRMTGRREPPAPAARPRLERVFDDPSADRIVTIESMLAADDARPTPREMVDRVMTWGPY